MDKTIKKPANKWRLRDFEPILHDLEYPRELTLGACRALFLTPVEGSDSLYRRWDIPELRQARRAGAKPQWDLAIPKWVQRDAEAGDWGALVQESAISANVEAVWVNL